MAEELKEIVVDETEWWDRLAMAVELIEKKSAVKKGVVTVGDESVSLITDRAADFELSAPPAAATIYFLEHLEDSEILRRMSQMPDETPKDLLMRPMAFYCPEEKTAVCVNSPGTALTYLLAQLRRQR
jgi:hypothetical protein